MSFDQATFLQLPITNVIHSKNAAVLVAGVEIIRSDRTTVVLNNNIAQFFEIGNEWPILYAGPFHARATLDMAYINSAGLRLAMGTDNPEILSGTTPYAKAGEDLEALWEDQQPRVGPTLGAGAVVPSGNYYQVPVEVMVEVNPDGIPYVDASAGTPTGQVSRVIEVTLRKCLLNFINMSWGTDGFIRGGPLEFEAEMVQVDHKDI